MRERFTGVPLLAWVGTLGVLGGVLFAYTPWACPLYAADLLSPVLVPVENSMVMYGCGYDVVRGCIRPLQSAHPDPVVFAGYGSSIRPMGPGLLLGSLATLKALLWDLQRRLGGDPEAMPRARPSPELSGPNGL